MAALSVNYVERFALMNGYTAQSVKEDYGYDMSVFTFDSKGEFENGNIYIQLKAKEKPKYIAGKKFLSLSINKKDIDTWYNEPNPVILVLYDVGKDRGHWVYVQQYLGKLPKFDIAKIKPNFTIRIPVTNIINKASLQLFRKYKNNTLKEIAKGNVITYS
ncbi:MAG: DUF4365 domain-containing protein [Chitinophagaceae bacterium]